MSPAQNYRSTIQPAPGSTPAPRRPPHHRAPNRRPHRGHKTEHGSLTTQDNCRSRRSKGSLGSAKPIACDGPEGRPRRGGRERDNRVAEEDGPVQHQLRAQENLIDQRRARGHPGRRAPARGLPKAGGRALSPARLDIRTAQFGSGRARILSTRSARLLMTVSVIPAAHLFTVLNVAVPPPPRWCCCRRATRRHSLIGHGR
jgi:hypothetical protein